MKFSNLKTKCCSLFIVFFYNQTIYGVWLHISLLAGVAARDNPTSGWMEGRADQWNLPRFRWIPHEISLCWGCWCFPPQQPSVCRLPLDEPHVVIYPLMTTLGSECTVVPLSTSLMSDTSKLALMLFRNHLALVRGVNNRFTFVRRTKTQLSS